MLLLSAVTHQDERRSCGEPTVAGALPTDGSPDFWLRGAARAVSPRPSDGCCRGARVPGHRLAQGGVGVCRTPTDGRCPRRAPATTRAASWLFLDRTQSKPRRADEVLTSRCRPRQRARNRTQNAKKGQVCLVAVAL